MINFPDLDDPTLSTAGHQALNQVVPFPDLSTAGRQLALQLQSHRGGDNVIVLAVVLGGVPVAQGVANYLNAPLDLIIIRRLMAPQGPGSQLCALSVGGSTIIEGGLVPATIPSTPVEHFINDAIAELKAREQQCRRRRPSIDLAGKTVIVVDCGMRSGSTMLASIRAVRTLKPARIIAAAPVTSFGGQAAVIGEVDELVCLARPRPFGHVGLWYKNFTRPGDDRVGEFVHSDAT
ncbi:MAG: putative phosphoribosyl transferase [Blastocatellia bacterium]|jgi:predicted phosphoribosyltransferase|nr:putative phosphoribosyl transferase [Blastocatellia bacterium]